MTESSLLRFVRVYGLIDCYALAVAARVLRRDVVAHLCVKNLFACRLRRRGGVAHVGLMGGRYAVVGGSGGRRDTGAAVRSGGLDAQQRAARR